jgi:hypothetical protein
MERTWTGRVRPASDAEHLAFVGWLSSPEGLSLLARSRLTSYRLVESDGRITVFLGADDPPALVSFLRNNRFWPAFWEFESASSADAVGTNGVERLVWRKAADR